MTGDFEIDDVLHRHGKSIAKATTPPREPSALEDWTIWLCTRSYDDADRRAKRFIIGFLALGLFIMWVACQATVDNWYNQDIYKEAHEIEMREHYWKFFKALAAHKRKQ